MGSVSARGESLWIKFNGVSGKVVRRPSGVRRGQETEARAVLSEVERQVVVERADLERDRSWPALMPDREAVKENVGALAAGLSFVDVPLVNAAETAVSVYTNGVLAGSKCYGV